MIIIQLITNQFINLIPLFSVEYIFYLYIGSFIRISDFKNYNEIQSKESQEFIMYLNYFGNMPLYHYLLKNTQAQKKDLNSLIRKEKENITTEIKKFYEKMNGYNNDPYVLMCEQIFRIISIVNQRKIFFFSELKEELLKLPLKYLEIKKETIEINDLKLFGLISNNEKINKFIIDLEKKNSTNEVEKNENILLYHTLFINKDNYCSNYISKISKNEMKFTRNNFNQKKTIFYLDYLFPLMEEIFFFYNLSTFIKISKLFDLLPPQTQGGLLEYIISENVKNANQFDNYHIGYYEIVDNFVANEFFIQNYITRKTETKRIFIENKKIITTIKKQLPHKNIFLIQHQFTGKYYDCAILIPTKDAKHFILLLLQISQKKNTFAKIF